MITGHYGYFFSFIALETDYHVKATYYIVGIKG